MARLFYHAPKVRPSPLPHRPLELDQPILTPASLAHPVRHPRRVHERRHARGRAAVLRARDRCVSPPPRSDLLHHARADLAPRPSQSLVSRSSLSRTAQVFGSTTSSSSTCVPSPSLGPSHPLVPELTLPLPLSAPSLFRRPLLFRLASPHLASTAPCSTSHLALDSTSAAATTRSARSTGRRASLCRRRSSRLSRSSPTCRRGRRASPSCSTRARSASTARRRSERRRARTRGGGGALSRNVVTCSCATVYVGACLSDLRARAKEPEREG